jgi:hypothetical protein
MDVQALIPDIASAIHAFVNLPFREAPAGGIDLAQLTHIALEERVAEFLEHAGHRFVTGVVGGVRKVRCSLIRDLWDSLPYLMPYFLTQRVESIRKLRTLC